MNLIRIAVVGSGASALATVRELLISKKDVEITVLDVANQNEPDKTFGLKSHFGSLRMYDSKIQNLEHVGMKPVVWPSGSTGGFSRIWGAVIDHDSADNFPNFMEFDPTGSPKFATTSFYKVLNRNQITLNNEWEIQSHRLAVDPTKCVMCGQCLTGCPKEAIWFAGNEWPLNPEIKHLNNYRVRTIVAQQHGIEVHAYAGDILNFDLVFLAAGPIASAQILMRSNYISSEVKFQDTQAVFFPALRKPIRETKESFALSQISAKLELDGKISKYLQIYPDSRNLTHSLKMHKPKLGRLISASWRFISPWVLTAISYSDSISSPNLVLKMLNSDHFQLSSDSMKQTKNEKRSQRSLKKSIIREFGIYPLFSLAKKAEPGESYHFGASTEIQNFNTSSRFSRVKVVDSSSLLEIYPGPITNKVMLNAQRIVRNALQGVS
jgi:ferredoxin